MTVCIAAFAANSKAIVCCADKAITIDDYVQWDADCDKIVEMNPSGTVCLTSGDDESIFRVMREMQRQKGFMDSLQASIDACEKSYKKALEEEIQIEFLNPRLLTREEYVAGITGGEINEYMLGLMKKIDDHDGSDFIVAGFDADKKPILIELTYPGLATDAENAGASAIGSGSEKATSRLLWAESKRSHPIERVLWDVFDAKANAEMAVGVGYEWDAAVILPGRVFRVEKKIKTLIEQAWSAHNRSPFDKYNPKEDIDPPPKSWPRILHRWAQGILPTDSPKNTKTSNTKGKTD